MVAGIRHLLKFGDGPSDAIMVDNADWLDQLDYIPSCAMSGGISRSTAC